MVDELSERILSPRTVVGGILLQYVKRDSASPYWFEILSEVRGSKKKHNFGYKNAWELSIHHDEVQVKF